MECESHACAKFGMRKALKHGFSIPKSAEARLHAFDMSAKAMLSQNLVCPMR